MRTRVVLLALAGCGRLGFEPRIDEPGTGGPIRLFAGQDHACMIQDFELACWGGNDQFQLGLGDAVPNDQTSPQRVPGDQRWIDVALGEDMSCGLDDTGAVWCWGSGVEGRLGLGVATSPTATTPAIHPDGRRYSALHAGREHTCAVGSGADAGTAWCWGRNGAMQLGNGTATVTGSPTQVAFATPDPGRDRRWAVLSGGNDHTCAVQDDDTLWCWGSNSNGQLGQFGGPVTREHPNQLDPARPWLDVDSGFDSSCARTTANDLYCWGRNDRGQLGLGDTFDRGGPTQVDGGVVAVEIGFELMCVLTDQQQIACSGDNSDGELGRGTSSPSESVLVPIEGTWTQVVAGDDFACGVDTANRAFCWGIDDRGQLGNGGAQDDPSSSVPAPIASRPL